MFPCLLNGFVALGKVAFFVATSVIVGGGALVYVGLGAAWFLGPLVLFSCRIPEEACHLRSRAPPCSNEPGAL